MSPSWRGMPERDRLSFEDSRAQQIGSGMTKTAPRGPVGPWNSMNRPNTPGGHPCPFGTTCSEYTG
jgi:hypothetical protein